MIHHNVYVYNIPVIIYISAMTFSTYNTFSGSIWNDNVPDNALSNDPTSCYMSGREQTSFWKMRFPEKVTVTQVNITGMSGKSDMEVRQNTYTTGCGYLNRTEGSYLKQLLVWRWLSE